MPTTWYANPTALVPAANNTFTYSDSALIDLVAHQIRLKRDVTPFAEAVDAAGTVGYWKLDEASGNALDVSGNGYDLTVSAATSRRLFDGVYIALPGATANNAAFINSAITHGGTAFTVECVIFVSAPKPKATFDYIFYYNATISAVNHYLQLAFNSEAAGGRLRLEIKGTSAAVQIYAPALTYGYHKVRVTVDTTDGTGTATNLYVDDMATPVASTTHRGIGTSSTWTFQYGDVNTTSSEADSVMVGSARISNVLRTSAFEIFSPDAVTATTDSTDVTAIADFDDFASAFADLVPAEEGAAGGHVVLQAQADGGAWTTIASGTAAGRITGAYAPTATASGALRVQVNATDGTSAGLGVSGLGFVYTLTPGVPGAPVLGAPTASTTTSVTLPITAAAGIQDTVLHAIAPDNTQVTVTIGTGDVPAGATTSYTMTGLSADVLYRFIAHHRNSDQLAGPDSNVVTARAAATFASETAEPAIPSAPVLGAPSAATASTITLTVTPAANALGGTTLYAVAADNTVTSFTLDTATAPVSTTTTYVASGLDNHVLYRLSAASLNLDAQWGAFSNVVTGLTADDSSLDRKIQVAVQTALQTLATTSSVIGRAVAGRAFTGRWDQTTADVLVRPTVSEDTEVVTGGLKLVRKTSPLSIRVQKRDAALDSTIHQVLAEIRAQHEHNPASISVTDSDLAALADITVRERATRQPPEESIEGVDLSEVDLIITAWERI